MCPRLSLAAIAWTFSIVMISNASPAAADEKAPLRMTLRSQVKGEDGRFKVAEKKVEWEPKKSALIICDMWDDHWCRSASRPVRERAGPLNRMVKTARSKGVFIIHAPSSVTAYYKETPQRRRALEAPFAKTPKPLSTAQRWGTSWCWPDPKREP